VHVIINCAASIDFNARIDHAIQSNILGSLRMMALAKDTQNLEVFTHVSTCYVNCNLRGLIREDIYEEGTADGILDDDPERKLETLLALPSRELIARTATLLGGYPNTYTYTKALCERLMKARRGSLTLNIVRPAIINTSYAEPFPGWLDSIAAAAALYMFSGLGIIKELEGNAEYVGDTVPVDIVVGNIIVSTAFNAFSNNLSIYHVGSSDRNPISWK
jgi:fatty acyl-CoA reductase